MRIVQELDSRKMAENDCRMKSVIELKYIKSMFLTFACERIERAFC